MLGQMTSPKKNKLHIHMNASIRWVTQALDVFGVSKYLDVVTPALLEISYILFYWWRF